MQNKKINQVKVNLLWNAGGNLVYLAAQWLITVLVTVLGGLEDAGVLSLAMSISASFQTLALFGIRNFQVSDIEGKYSNSTYVGFRSVTCAAALLLCLIFALLNGYSPEVCHAITLFMLFRLAENYSDVLHGVAQNNNRLDIAGKSFAVKGVGILAVFICGHKLGGLLVGIGAMALFSLLSTLLYDLPSVKRVASFGLRAPIKQYGALARVTFPLCIYQFLNALISTLPKWFLEIQCGAEVLGAYSSIFSPVMLLQAAGTYLYVPFATIFTGYCAEKKRRETMQLFLKITAAIVAFFLITFVAAIFLGEWLLVFIFGEQIRPFVNLLMPILLANLAVTYLGFLTMLAVVIRKIGTVLAGFGVGTAALLATPFFIDRFGANGASYALIISAVIINVVLLWRILTTVLSFGRASKDA